MFPYQVWCGTKSPGNSKRAKKMWANGSQLQKLSKVCPFRFCPFSLGEMMLLFCGYQKGTSHMKVSRPASGESQKVLLRLALSQIPSASSDIQGASWGSVPWTLATSCQVGLFIYIQRVCVCVCECVHVCICGGLVCKSNCVQSDSVTKSHYVKWAYLYIHCVSFPDDSVKKS